MNWKILCIGKPRLSFAREGIAEYLGRMERYRKIQFKPLRSSTAPQESEALLTASGTALRLVLDEKGESLTTAEFAEWVRQKELAGTKVIAVLVGGAEGHCDVVRQSADRVLSLSALTLQHELALVVFLEQLYRVHSLLAGSPYHREGSLENKERS